MLKKSTLFLFGIIFLTPHQDISAQSSHLFEIGTIDSIYSRELSESREIYVQLPESFEANSQRKYPVVFVLDGDDHLNALSIVHSYYWGGFMPEMVLIGISNRENRTRDLTTSNVSSRRGAQFNQESGGAEKFTKFIEKELIPYVESKYPVTRYRTLIGHSYGGLFTVNTLINHSALFENYLAIDPSLDWDNQKLLNHARSVLGNKDFGGKSLFITLGGQLHMQNSEINIDNVMQDTSSYTLFPRSNIEFSKLAEKNKQNGLNTQWKYYPQDLHGSIPLPSMLDGLIYLFKWFQMENTDLVNNPDTPLEELMKVVSHREKKLEDHFGYFVPPYDEELVNMLGYMNLQMGQMQKSLSFFQLGTKYFPLSANVYDSLGDYYEAQGDFENAFTNVSKAYELSGDDYHKQRMEKFKSLK